MHEEHLIRRVKTLIEDYSFTQPFAIYLKEYFRKNPQMGARDRRETRGWCFNLLRIGLNLQEASFEKRLSVACFLCNNNLSPSLSYLLKRYTEFNVEDVEKTVEDKVKIVCEKFPSFNLENIFPMHDHLSPSLNSEKWFLSFLRKPRVWIRIKKSLNKAVISELNEKKISYHTENDPLILSFQPDVALEKTLSFQNGFFEIQDLSSQLTQNYFHSKPGEHWWDACAGAGGKSLLLKDENSDVNIFATDIRENILDAYSARMKKSGYRFFQTEVADLSSPGFVPDDKKFDGIIADVPCSGSGTWARSPEWLQKNTESRLKDFFVPLQRKIISALIPSLKPGFPMIFITCSVFREENEENIRYFMDHFHLKLEKSAYLEGYDRGADTLFVARLIRLF